MQGGDGFAKRACQFICGTKTIMRANMHMWTTHPTQCHPLMTKELDRKANMEEDMDLPGFHGSSGRALPFDMISLINVRSIAMSYSVDNHQQAKFSI